MQNIKLTQAQTIITAIQNGLSENIVGILIVAGLIIGLAMVAMLIDLATGAWDTEWRSPTTGRSYKIRK